LFTVLPRLLTGPPPRGEFGLTGVVGQLIPAREDLTRLVANVPAQFWRAVGSPASSRGDEVVP
jgi:hypothetical protein